MTEPVRTSGNRKEIAISSQWTPEAIRALGPTTDLPTLGSILGVSRWKAYKMAQAGEWGQVGIRIVPIGTKYRVAVQSILEVLGYSDPADTGTGREPSAPGHKQLTGNAQDHAIAEPPGRVAARSIP
jgi:hypothetical protein